MPSAGSTRDRRYDRTQARIVDVTRRLILAYGVDQVTVRDIARELDCSPSAIYRYFPSKEELIALVAAESLQALADYLEAVPTDLPSPERVIALGEAYLRFAKEHPKDLTLVFSKLDRPTATWPDYVRYSWPFTVIIDAVRAGAKDGSFVETPGFGPEDMALGAWALAHGLAMLRLTHLLHIQTDLDPTGRRAFQAYAAGLAQTRES
jgi:AcrR family transcriptional regulator